MKGGENIPFYQYVSKEATLIISAENQDDSDQILTELVKEPRIFDYANTVAV